MSMRCRIASVALIAALTASPFALEAQSTPSVGTATGWGVLGLTESRFGEALLWNPALLAMPDSDMGGFTAPSLDLSVAGRGASPLGGGARAVSTLRGAAHGADDWTAGRSLAGGMEGTVLWFGSHLPGFALSLDTRFHGRVRFPADAVSVLAGQDSLDAVTGTGEIRWGMSTSLTGGRALSIGHLPLLGWSWFGGAGRFTRVHSHAAGSLITGTAAEIAATLPDGSLASAVEDEAAAAFDVPVLLVEGGRILGVDVGLVSVPAPTMVLSLTATNVYQSASVDDGSLRIRHFHSLGEEVRPATAEEEVDAASLAGEALQAFSDHVASVRFPRVLKGAFAVDLRDWRLGAAGGWVYENTAAIGRRDVEVLGLSVARLSTGKPRLHLATLSDGSWRVGAGRSFGVCDVSTIALTARIGEGSAKATTLGLSFAHGFGGRPGC